MNVKSLSSHRNISRLHARRGSTFCIRAVDKSVECAFTHAWKWQKRQMHCMAAQRVESVWHPPILCIPTGFIDWAIMVLSETYLLIYNQFDDLRNDVRRSFPYAKKDQWSRQPERNNCKAATLLGRLVA
ncbi:hypothetical protein ACI3LX_005000 [Candidozyma auris]